MLLTSFTDELKKKVCYLFHFAFINIANSVSMGKYGTRAVRQ